MSDSSIHALIQAVEQADSPERLIGAVQALAASESEAAIPTLIQALGFNNPAAAVIAVRGLVHQGDAAVAPLLTLLDDYNYGARAYAIRALSAIANAQALTILLASAEADFAPSVRRAATKGLGMLRWSTVSPDQVDDAKHRVLQSLGRIIQDVDWSLRYAAIVGLQALGEGAPTLIPAILHSLEHCVTTDDDRAVQARGRLAIAKLSELQTASPLTMVAP